MGDFATGKSYTTVRMEDTSIQGGPKK